MVDKAVCFVGHVLETTEQYPPESSHVVRESLMCTAVDDGDRHGSKCAGRNLLQVFRLGQPKPIFKKDDRSLI